MKIRKTRLRRSLGHRMSLLRNLSIALIDNGRILTLFSIAKNLRGFFEKLLTRAKVDSLANKRIISSRLSNDKEATENLIKIAKLNLNRHGGYTRVIKAGKRRDSSETAYIEIINYKQKYEPDLNNHEEENSVNSKAEESKAV